MKRLLLAWGLLLALVVLLRTLDPWGDRGLVNVATLFALLAAVLLGVVAALRRSAWPWSWRLAPLALVAGACALSAGFFPLQGFSGEMVPQFRARRAPAALPPVVPAAGSAVAALAAPGPHDFPHFLGPTRDLCLPGPALAHEAEARPRLRWRRPLGAGWSAFALRGGVGVTLEEDEGGQHAVALALDDGRTLWRTRIDESFTHALGGAGPRATPAIAGERVFVLGAHGMLVALDLASGQELWRRDLQAEGGLDRAREAELAQYGRSASPLVVDGLVLAPIGGSAGLGAFEEASGAVRWTSPARHFSHASPGLATLHGRSVVLAVNESSLTGHALESGAILFEHPWPGTTSGDASVSQALGLDGERVLVTKGYGVGGLLLRLTPAGAGFASEVLWQAPRLLRTKMTNVVVQAGHVFALDDGMLECVELARGTKVWKEGRFGHGQLLAVGDTLLVLAEDGVLHALALDPTRPAEVRWSAPVLEGKCWAHLALSYDLLVVRNAEECAAWELPLADGAR